MTVVAQAKKVDNDGASGLIPSQTLEEKRKAFVRPEYDYTHKSCMCSVLYVFLSSVRVNTHEGHRYVHVCTRSSAVRLIDVTCGCLLRCCEV